MKVSINKKFSDIAYSCYLLSFILALCSFGLYNEYSNSKEVFEYGKPTIGIIEKTYCKTSSRGTSSAIIKLVKDNITKSLKLDSKSCFEYNVGDSILVLFLQEDKPILKFDANIKELRKVELYLSIFFLLLAIFFLMFSIDPNNKTPEKRKYKRGERH